MLKKLKGIRRLCVKKIKIFYDKLTSGALECNHMYKSI